MRFFRQTDAKFQKTDVMIAFKNLQSKLMRSMILDEKRRIDGRGLKEIRKIDIEQSILPRTHGSSLFTRGETQTIAVCTLAAEAMLSASKICTAKAPNAFICSISSLPFRSAKSAGWAPRAAAKSATAN